MAAGSIAAPGTENGPCVDENCGHKDCASIRKIANTICYLCNKPIGYNKRFYVEGTSPKYHSHAVCLEEKAEKERAGQ